jgi:cytochrome c biogenesis protein CcmG/thiol:disulfide interchange protein DsbE
MTEAPSKQPPEQKPKSRLWSSILPLFIFLGIAGASYSLLSTEGRNVSALPSALLDKPAPKLDVPPLEGLIENGRQIPGMDKDMFTSSEVNRISIVNVFASWCVPCRQEHPYIVELGKDERIQLIGINQRDSTRNALSFLAELGNPYDAVGVDRKGRASIEWGVYGVPETFIVNRQGRIIYKHVGPINARDLQQKFMPIIEEALKSNSSS